MLDLAGLDDAEGRWNSVSSACLSAPKRKHHVGANLVFALNWFGSQNVRFVY